MAEEERAKHVETMSMDEDEMDCDESESSDENDISDDKESKKVFLPGEPLNEGEELVRDESAYIMYHEAQTGAPCLSFDILPDGLGNKREDFPLTSYLVAGTQAERSHLNNIIVMKMSNLHKTTKHDEDDEELESEDEDEEEKPELELAMLKHSGGVNRIRATQVNGKCLAATWADTGKVFIWDLTKQLNAVNDSSLMAAYNSSGETQASVFSFSGHQTEGFAIDWSPTVEGRLATGDCKKNIHIWNPKDGGVWHVDQRPYIGHTDSVEDIQWSPNESNVFASCSVDRSIRIWDSRAAPNKACMLTTSDAHSSDVNVIHWNRNEPFIASGGDDGMIKIWDLRQFQHGKAVATFKHHTAPITSVEWNNNDSTVLVAAGADDQVTLWDLAVEKDVEASKQGKEEEDLSVPPQLLFIHQGQKDIKEVHWHPQLNGVLLSTAHTGFNIFRTISV